MVLNKCLLFIKMNEDQQRKTNTENTTVAQPKPEKMALCN